MKWFKRILSALVLLLVIAVALPFFIQLNDYIPQIEKEASIRLKQPVSIKSIRFAALPLPHVTVEGITVGSTDDIRIGKVRVIPDLFSSLQSVRVIKSIEIDALTLTPQAISTIAAWAKPDAAQSPQVLVESLRFNDVRISFGKAGFGPFDAKVSLDGAGKPQEMSIVTQDGKLKAFIKPDPSDKSNYLIDASAKAWTLPVGPALVFDELIVRGVATLNDVNLSQMSARLYGGKVDGRATASWQNGWRLKGRLDINQVEIQKIASTMLPKTHVSGKLSAKPAFAASAASVAQLVGALQLNTPFNVQNGALYGVDIQKAATAQAKQGKTGGETRFEQLSGYLVMERGGFRFTQLKIASGSLAVDGNVSVSPKKALSGRINAQVNALGASANVPLNVAGTVDAPLLYPTGGTIAGAAVGTVLLGPGFGTSVGAKVGGWAEGLFGKSNEKKPKK